MSDKDISRSERELDGGSIAPHPDNMLDSVDRHILNIIQSSFPLESRPYAAIGRTVGVSEEEAFARVQKMKQRKTIRRIGANFNSAKLGFRSTLCAAKVPEEKLTTFVAEVNAHPGVTHNYLRSHAYNVWFTCIAPSWEELCTVIDGIADKTGIAILNLPATRLYKVKVDFQLE
jgi:DNA-binding Lrp family transcriptional regulator